MAAVGETVLSRTVSADDDLTDEQMQDLLAEATARLIAQNPSLRAAEKKDKWNFPKLDPGQLERPYVSQTNSVAKADAARLVQDEQRKKAEQDRTMIAPVVQKQAAFEARKADAGSQWFHMPKTDLTPELKRDLQLLKMRNVLDPHRHYKKDGGKMKAPEYSQVGRIIEGPTEFFSGRIENKQRKKTFIEEVLAGEQETGRFKRKYGEYQEKQRSGKNAFYQALKAKRKGLARKGRG